MYSYPELNHATHINILSELCSFCFYACKKTFFSLSYDLYAKLDAKKMRTEIA